MSFRPKDDLEETKSSVIYLDLSDLLVFTKEDLEKTLSRLPDLKLKSDPFEEALSSRYDSYSIQSSILSTHKQTANQSSAANSCLSKTTLLTPISKWSSTLRPFVYLTPLPHSMKNLNLNDFCGTEIDWKMLTLLRPKTKLEEDYLSKLVELYKFRHKTRIEDGYGLKKAVFRLSRHPRVMQYKPVNLAFDSFGFKSSENTKSLFIKEDITYEAFARVPIETTVNQYNDESFEFSEKNIDLKKFFDQNF